MPLKGKASRRVTVAITGASGAVYGIRLVSSLLEEGCGVDIILSPAGKKVLKEELGLDWEGEREGTEQRIRSYFRGYGDLISYHAHDDLLSPLSSGSHGRREMVICPCSMGTLSRISHGASTNLIERAADVVIKEGGKLLLVPRETPLNPIHLENMLKLARIGVIILPAMPAFYHRPEGIDDLIDFLVGKILDRLGIKNHLYQRWREVRDA